MLTYSITNRARETWGITNNIQAGVTDLEEDCKRPIVGRSICESPELAALSQEQHVNSARLSCPGSAQRHKQGKGMLRYGSIWYDKDGAAASSLRAGSTLAMPGEVAFTTRQLLTFFQFGMDDSTCAT
uniref:Uncharacterized protein n=1 Tax=Coccidioides posadasii RMSCC 3488 TaxID=454284 RepID=A0A0J6FMP1_COCPO|nr:hypothetical protein CPAG_06461 [Coccidioides posadasii RMSCC 3488]